MIISLWINGANSVQFIRVLVGGSGTRTTWIASCLRHWFSVRLKKSILWLTHVSADQVELRYNARLGVSAVRRCGCRHLVERLDNMKNHVLGNGTSQCLLCGEEFRLLGASASECELCSKVTLSINVISVQRHYTAVLIGRIAVSVCLSICALRAPSWKRKRHRKATLAERSPRPGITGMPISNSKSRRPM